MPFDHAAYDGQPDPRPFKFLVAMQTLEDTEQLIDIFHVESGAVVPNKDRYHTGFRVPRTDFNPRVLPFARVLESVRNQIEHRLMKQCRVAFNVRQIPKIPTHAPSRGLWLQLLQNTIDNVPQMNPPAAELHLPKAREAEQVIQQLPHLLRRSE